MPQLAGFSNPMWCPLVSGSWTGSPEPLPMLEIPNVASNGFLEGATLTGDPITGFFNEGTGEISFARTFPGTRITPVWSFDGYVWDEGLTESGLDPQTMMAGTVDVRWIFSAPWAHPRPSPPPPPLPLPWPPFGSSTQGWFSGPLPAVP